MLGIDRQRNEMARRGTIPTRAVGLWGSISMEKEK